jgi:hypothetical protein
MTKGMKNLLICALILTNTYAFAQLSNINGWQERAMLNRPSKVKTTVYNVFEKFGEQTEKSKYYEELTFNIKGNYLSIKSGDLNPEDRNRQKLYYYEVGTNRLLNMKISGNIYSTNTIEYEYSSDNLIKYLISSDCSDDYSICKQEFEYDGQKRNTGITYYDKKGDILRIEKFSYKGLLLSDMKTFDKSGKLYKNKQLLYNAKGLLVQKDDYIKGNGEMILDNHNNIEYNTKNDTIKKTFCNRTSSGTTSCYSLIYSYEYYPTGFVKKLSTYRIYKNGRDEYSDNWEYYVYDKFNNWIEKTIWTFNSITNQMKPTLKYTREIAY